MLSLKGFLKWIIEEKSLFSPTDTILGSNLVGGIPYPNTRYLHFPNSDE